MKPLVAHKTRPSVSPDVTAPGRADPVSALDDTTRSRADRELTSGSDPVEAALASALTEAAAAGRFDVVAEMARTLEARRTARTSSNVVDLTTRRAKR